MRVVSTDENRLTLVQQGVNQWKIWHERRLSGFSKHISVSAFVGKEISNPATVVGKEQCGLSFYPIGQGVYRTSRAMAIIDHGAEDEPSGVARRWRP